jgi:ATP-dependent Lhr-like helicase
VSVFGRLSPRLQQAIVHRLGWTSLRPVQEFAGEALLAGDNAVILAPTAGGKTEAAIFPVLSGLIDNQPAGVGVLYIAPIKALLNNQAERLGLYAEMVGLRRFVWHGDVDDGPRRRFLKEPAELLLTTPESLEVLLMSPRVDAAVLFGGLQAIVIDEVHAMAGSDRGAHLMSVIERIGSLTGRDIQRIGLSATVGNPAAILHWLCGSSKRASRVVDPPRVPNRRQLLVAFCSDVQQVAQQAGRLAKGQKCLFFCETRAASELVAEQLRRTGTAVFVHHSAVSREEREIAEERFARGSDACIVCTSTLELGIDVGDLDRVLQHEAPSTVSSFLQRIGRTGRRAGQASSASFLCESTAAVLQAVALIELARTGWVEDVPVQTRCWPALVHQLLAMALADSGIPQDAAWGHFSHVPDFSGIQRDEFDSLVAHMLADDTLILTAGRLILGPRAVRKLGRRNFMELYSVFTSPQHFTVVTAQGAPIGTLQQEFVDQLVDGISCFLLGGRAWALVRVQFDDRRVVVEGAGTGKQPTWGGYLPQFLGQALCEQIRDVLLSDVSYAYLDPAALQVLQQKRESFRDILAEPQGGVELRQDEVCWWTFAGGRINATLRQAIEALGGDWKVVPDNFCVRVTAPGLTLAAFLKVREQFELPAFWENAELWQGIAQTLPPYRLSKFQALMPPAIQAELVAEYLLDVDGARRRVLGAPQSGLGVPTEEQCGGG